MNARMIFIAVLGISSLYGFALGDWTEPVPVIEVNTQYAETSPFLSYDGLSLYFARGNTSGYYYFRIFEATRQEPSGPFTSVKEVLNSSGQHVFTPWVSPDNLRMYYHAEIESQNRWLLKVTERDSVNDPWPQGSDISELNQLGKIHKPGLTADELTIVFTSNDIAGGKGGYDIWMANRPDMNSPFENVTNLSEINTASSEGGMYISPDGLTLYFHSDRNGSAQLFRATRASINEQFGNVEHLSSFDTPGGSSASPSLSSDGTALYFVRALTGQTKDIYVSFLFDPRKASNPYPVDKATYVDPNVVLSWAPGKDAISRNVYLGTNYDDVNDADTLSNEYKGNYDVNSYDPCGLDPGTTYFWRIDEVADSNICKGDIWKFTTRTEPNIINWQHWTEPAPVMEINTEYAEWTPFISFDGLSLYFARGRTSSYYHFRIFEATRQNPYGPFTSVNQVLSTSGKHLFAPWVSPDNLRMYYFAQTENPILWQLKLSERASVNDPWPQGNNISELNMLGKVSDPRLTADELIIFFRSSTITGGQGGYDLWMATRPDRYSPFDTVRNLAEINTADNEVCPSVSPDGLTLIFQAGTYGDWQFFRATRQSLSEAFGNIEILPILEIPGYTNNHPSLSGDGSALYFIRLLDNDISTGDIYVSYLIDPNKASAPSPADGATFVDPNVILSWAPGKDALSHDVYLGTSFNDVNDANTLSDEYKGNYDVNSFDPCGLESGTTYYWRVDEVSDSNISKGYVWTFTTLLDLDSHLVAWWTFDEGQGSIAHDSTGTNHGTVYGATWTTGKINGALDFDGIDDYVDIPYNSNLDRDASEGISLSVWFKLNSYPTGFDQGPVFGLFDSTAAGVKNYLFIDKPVYGNLITWIQHPPVLGGMRSIKPDLDTWYHVVAVEYSPLRAIYINGSLDSSDNLSRSYSGNTPDTIRIGNRADSALFYFDGSIDDVMIFDRALSDEEIFEVYQSSLCQPGYPCISVWPESLEFYAEEGGPNPATQTLSICNFGDDILNYNITEDCPWLEVDPNAGSSAGEPNEIIVSVDISGLKCGIYDCNLIISDPNASNHPRIVPVELEVFHEYCNIDVRVVPVAVLTDPTTTDEDRKKLPDSITGVVRGGTYYIEIWASDVRTTNTGLTGVYVDVDFCSQTTASAVEHGTIFVTFPDGTIQPGGVDEFGGSALPSGGGIEPRWVRVGWIRMSAQVETETCTISLLPSSTGIAALDRGLIPWTAVDLGSIELQITPPARSYDLDGDNFIGLSDLSYFAASWKQQVPPANEAHDFDCDGKVGVGDLSWFATGWQKNTNDPTILYPPCSIEPEAAWMLNNSIPEMQNSDNFQTSDPIDIDIAFSMAVLDSPSSSDTTTTLPTSVKKISAGQTYYLELWVSDRGYVNTGLTSAYVDLSFPADAATVINVSNGSIFTLFNEEAVLSGEIDELGGSSLPGGDGIEPEWARVAVVEIVTDATLPFVMFTLSPSDTGVAALGRGTIPWDDISLGPLLICPADFDKDADVDEKDLAIFSSAWRTQPGDPQWNPDCDITPSGYIDRSDLAWVVDSWLIGIVP